MAAPAPSAVPADDDVPLNEVHLRGRVSGLPAGGCPTARCAAPASAYAAGAGDPPGSRRRSSRAAASNLPARRGRRAARARGHSATSGAPGAARLRTARSAAAG